MSATDCECGGSGRYPNKVTNVGIEWLECPYCPAGEIFALGQQVAALVRERDEVAEDYAALIDNLRAVEAEQSNLERERGEALSELARVRLDRAELADEVHSLRRKLSAEARAERAARAVAQVTPCSCSAQRARAEAAEAERDEAWGRAAHVLDLLDAAKARLEAVQSLADTAGRIAGMHLNGEPFPPAVTLVDLQAALGGDVVAAGTVRARELREAADELDVSANRCGCDLVLRERADRIMTGER